MITVQLASKFLFSSGLHTKKSLRGPAHEWYELLTLHLRYSKAARAWFCQEALFDHPSRFVLLAVLECFWLNIVILALHSEKSSDLSRLSSDIESPFKVRWKAHLGDLFFIFSLYKTLFQRNLILASRLLPWTHHLELLE